MLYRRLRTGGSDARATTGQGRVERPVLEKHSDFLRDFRGDTIHPSTLELMHELGLLDEFLKVPHQEVSRLTFQVGAAVVVLAFGTLLLAGYMVAERGACF